uniref:MAP kinase-activating death domain protein isoform X2 n=2 Tax=Myxine glutinosa TaxID=7769 RepID=UPI003590007C
MPAKSCPRLLDYLLVVGARKPRGDLVSQTPELLRRLPVADHAAFPLPPDVVYFCQPEGCVSIRQRRPSLRPDASFVFTLTDKDSGLTRYGVCMNFYRPFQSRVKDHAGSKPSTTPCGEGSENAAGECAEDVEDLNEGPRHRRSMRSRNGSLTSLCIISHYAFFSTFRECLYLLKRLVEGCGERMAVGGPAKESHRELAWLLFLGLVPPSETSVPVQELAEVEAWARRLLLAPVPVPGRTRLDVEVMPSDLQPPLTFALPDPSRLALVDFPLHLPLELLGVDVCLRALSCILLENKVIFQSRDYNALSMSVMAFVAMLYPLEYMFPVIPLLPTCMAAAEQLLLAPTPYIIGVPASFFLYKIDFALPDDVWLVDLDTSRVVPPSHNSESISLSEPEATQLKTHLKQALVSMSLNAQPIPNLDRLPEGLEVPLLALTGGRGGRDEGALSSKEFNPFIYGNDIDSVDVATRVALIRFLNSPNVLGGFTEHTRTLRLYPRPVVAFQSAAFLASRPQAGPFTRALAHTQAVEYYAEWILTPSNFSFQRVHEGVFDPAVIGDKPKWYAHRLQSVHYSVCAPRWPLAFALHAPPAQAASPAHSSCNSDDEDGDSSSSYSSLGDFVNEMMLCDIRGEVEDSPSAEISDSVGLSPTQGFQPFQHYPGDDGAVAVGVGVEENEEFAEPTAAVEQSSAQKEEGKLEQEESHKQVEKTMEVERAISTQDVESKLSPITGVQSQAVSESVVMLGVGIGSGEEFENPCFEPRSRRSVDGDEEQSYTPNFPTYGPSRLRGDSDVEAESQAEPAAPDSLSSLMSFASSLYHNHSTSFSLSHIAMAGRQTKERSTPFPSVRGTKRALVDQKSVIKHSPTVKRVQTPTANKTSNSENQIFLKEVVSEVQEGQGVGYFKLKRVRRLMESEGLRSFVLARLARPLHSDETRPETLPDFEVTRKVYKGILDLLKCCVCGLEYSFSRAGLGGMASMFSLLELAHSHYYSKESDKRKPPQDDLSRQSIPGMGARRAPGGSSAPATSQAAVQVLGDPPAPRDDTGSKADTHSLNEENFAASIAMWDKNQQCRCRSSKHKLRGTGGLGVARDSDSHLSSDSAVSGLSSARESSLGASLPSLVKSSSQESETNTMQSSSSGETLGADSDGGGEGVPCPGQVSASFIRAAVSDSELDVRSDLGPLETVQVMKPTPTIVPPAPELDPQKVFLYEGLLGKERSTLWDQLQFWEDAFLDAVALEREGVGMDQGLRDMMDRYQSLGENERRRLENDEDRLLATLLHNMTAFMVMVKVVPADIKKKVRRLVGKSHIGLSHSQELNELLDSVATQSGRSVPVKVCGSRHLKKHTFVVHSGTNTQGDIFFMEVCDDCIVLRSSIGTIFERWWYEKLINMTYCPKTKVLCLWRRQGPETQLNKFYTKKCRELYYCVKESMERAAARHHGVKAGPELGAEFPVQDLSSGESGLLQVTLEGINLKFVQNQVFIELNRIKKCHTDKGVFLLQEFVPEAKEVVIHKFKTPMAHEICYAVLCLFSYVAAVRGKEQHLVVKL